MSMHFQTILVNDDDMTDESPVIKRNKKKPKPIADDPFVSDDDDDFQGIVHHVTGRQNVIR